MLGLAADDYTNSIVRVLTFSDIMTGLLKSIIFGLIITTIACYQGMRATSGAQGVGKATTQSVVHSSICILISNYLMTQLFEALNL